MTRATNASVMRTSNRKLILNLIRLGPVSRAELAEHTRLTRAAITQIVDELLEAGLVEPCPQEGTSFGPPGRRPTLLQLRPGSRFVFGVHLTRHHGYVGVVDLCGNVLAQEKFSLEHLSPECAADSICQIICAQTKALRLSPETIWGIGISAPGPVDHRAGIILNPPNFDIWHNTSICAMLELRTGLPVVLEKDTNARALEEKYFGAAKDTSGFMLVQVDEGVGSGVVIKDTLYRGTRGLGTEIGHTTIRYDGPPCRCGGRGCLENYLKIPALLKGSRFSCWKELTAQAHLPEAEKILDLVTEYLTAALINAFNLYDLERIFLSGELTSCPQALLEGLNLSVGTRMLNTHSAQPPLVCIGSDAIPVRTGAMAALYDIFQDRN